MNNLPNLAQYIKVSTTSFALFIASLVGLFLVKGEMQGWIFAQFVLSAVLYVISSILETRKA